MYLEPSARTGKRLERVAALLEEGNVDRELLETLLRRYQLNLPNMNESRIHRDLRAGKRALRQRRRELSLPEKVEQVVQLQRIVLPQIRRRRGLKPWEKVWDLNAPQRR